MSEALWNTLVTLAGGAIVAIGAYFSYRSWRRQARATALVDSNYERVNTLSRAEAEREARALLESSVPFEAAREPLLAKERSLVQQLPADAASFFTSWSAVAGGGMRLARSEIRPFQGDSSCIRIGADVENADIIVRKTDGHVFVVESGDAAASDEGYLSIWHYLLEVAVHPD